MSLLDKIVNKNDPQAAMREQIREYRKLQEITNSEDFNTFFDLQIKTVAEKMLWTFTSGKNGDNIKSWEDFVTVRGEIKAMLYPIQEVFGAGPMIKYLENQLEQYKQQD